MSHRVCSHPRRFRMRPPMMGGVARLLAVSGLLGAAAKSGGPRLPSPGGVLAGAQRLVDTNAAIDRASSPQGQDGDAASRLRLQPCRVSTAAQALTVVA